jgi:Rubisco LSMT substrate-binding
VFQCLRGACLKVSFAWPQAARCCTALMSSKRCRAGINLEVADVCESDSGNCCMQALASFPTTTRADEQHLAALQQEPATFARECWILAVQYRMQHKRGLAQGYKLASVCLDSLSAASGTG